MQFLELDKKILAIISENTLLNKIKSIVKKHLPNCELIISATNNQGISNAINENPDSILLNFSSDEKDSILMCQKLQQNPNTNQIPILFIVDQKTTQTQKLNLLSAGAEAFIQQTFDEADFLSSLQNMFRIKQATEHLQYKNKLIHSEEKLRFIFDKSPLGVSVTNLQGIFIEVNQAYCNLLGYTKEELLGRHFNDFTSPEDRNQNQKIYSTLVKNELSGFDLEKRYLHKTGKTIYVKLKAQLAKDNNGKPLFEIAVAEDITEQKESEIKLQEKEENLRLIIENSPMGVTATDLKGIFNNVNPAFCQMIGYKKEEMIGKHFNTFSHPSDANKNQHLFENLVNGKIPYFDLEKRYIHKNGQIVYGLIRAQVIRDQQGNPLFQTALIENITEQKKIIEALKENEQKFRDLANLLPQIVYEIDLKGNLTFANKFGIEAFGYSKEETKLNFNILKIIAPEDQKRASTILSNIKNENISGNPEYTCIKKDGTRVPVLIYSSVVYKNNKPAGMRGVIIDITERKKSELIQKAIYNISNAVITVDTVEKLIEIIRQQLSTIIDTTNFYVALYNPELDLLALPFFADEKDDLKFIPKGKSLTKHVFETKKSLLVDSETEKKLASKGIIEEIGTMSKIWMGVPLKIDEQVFGVLAVQSYTNENAYNQSDLKILEFVSEQISLSINRKKALDDLKLALEKATESDRLKSAFLATMSHELRTPLNAIIGFSEFLTPELDSESVGKFGEIIHKSGNHLLSIVNDLFDITLIESGETKLRKEEIILDSIFLDVSNLIIAKQYRDNKTNIELKYHLPTDCEGFVFRTDENKLKQVLINLLKNALKFTSEGHIYYGCNLIKEETNSTLKFYVEDSGIGISKDKQEIIFEMFRQVEDGSTRKYEGAGIGLSVAKRLVELLGGTIWVESEINEGSTFYFTIPVEESRLEKINIFNELTFLEIKEKVLIVEDNRASAEFIETVLNKYGLQCLFAENGQEAVELCVKQKNIALILMDINLPVKDGLAATKEIKQLRPNLPIIAQTAYAVAGDKEKALASGCDDYISKPINQKELIEKLKVFLK